MITVAIAWNSNLSKQDMCIICFIVGVFVGASVGYFYLALMIAGEG